MCEFELRLHSHTFPSCVPAAAATSDRMTADPSKAVAACTEEDSQVQHMHMALQCTHADFASVGHMALRKLLGLGRMRVADHEHVLTSSTGTTIDRTP